MIKFLVILLNAFFVFFTDKPLSGEPSLSPRAQEQRIKWHIETDELDYPVNDAYLDSLRNMGITIYHTSRWFNGASCEMNEAQEKQVENLPFVAKVEMTRDDSAPNKKNSAKHNDKPVATGRCYRCAVGFIQPQTVIARRL